MIKVWDVLKIHLLRIVLGAALLGTIVGIVAVLIQVPDLFLGITCLGMFYGFGLIVTMLYGEYRDDRRRRGNI